MIKQKFINFYKKTKQQILIAFCSLRRRYSNRIIKWKDYYYNGWWSGYFIIE